jgi:hypothetical protein
MADPDSTLWQRLRDRLRPAPPRAEADKPPRTLLRAAIAGGILLLLIAVVAQTCSAPVAPFQMERYVKLGPRQGPQTLERELLATHAPGSSLANLLNQLSLMGFTCPGVAGDTPVECRFRARRSDGMIATITVTIRNDGRSVAALAAAMELGNR